MLKLKTLNFFCVKIIDIPTGPSIDIICFVSHIQVNFGINFMNFCNLSGLSGLTIYSNFYLAPSIDGVHECAFVEKELGAS